MSAQLKQTLRFWTRSYVVPSTASRRAFCRPDKTQSYPQKLRKMFGLTRNSWCPWYKYNCIRGCVYSNKKTNLDPSFQVPNGILGYKLKLFFRPGPVACIQHYWNLVSKFKTPKFLFEKRRWVPYHSTRRQMLLPKSLWRLIPLRIVAIKVRCLASSWKE